MTSDSFTYSSLENPLWVNPYSNWAEEPQSPSVTFTYKP